MSGKFYQVGDLVPDENMTSMAVITRSQIHEIHLWRIKPGEWIYPHVHPYNDDIWYIIQGVGKYYLSAEKTREVKPGDISVAKPGNVHGIFNSGFEDIIVYSVLSPLPVEFEPAPDFEYPE